MATLVSPRPRKMPPATAWVPSNTWNTPASGMSDDGDREHRRVVGVEPGERSRAW